MGCLVAWFIGFSFMKYLEVKKLEFELKLERKKIQILRMQLGTIDEIADRTLKEESFVDDEWQNE